MIKFTDERLYVQGIGTAIMTDPKTGDILYFTDKAQEGNIVPSADDGIINAGIGNATAIMIPSNSQVQVDLTAADYSEYAKSASVGAKLQYGAPVMTCQTITASSPTLAIDVSTVTPVAGVGENKIVCYVQEVGEASPIATGGTAYALDPDTGEISDFAATVGKRYLVTYHVSQANASLRTVTTNMKGKVVRFVMQRPIYTNVDAATNKGTLWGMYYDIIPCLQLMPSGAGMSGNQTSPTTTAISGRALPFDDDVISAGCTECELDGSPLWYSVVVPCNTAEGVKGIVGVLGGTVELVIGEAFQLAPSVVVGDALTYGTPASDFTYSSSASGVASVGASTGRIVAVSAGKAQITISYFAPGSDTVYKDFIDVTVKAS